MMKILVLLTALLLLAGCSSRTGKTLPQQSYSKKPKTYKKATMRPYTIRGKRYYPTVVEVGETMHGNASWYGPNFHGKLTSNGETYDMHAMTAAHKTLPMNTIVRATHKQNGKSIVVRINDRGPFVETRIIDLSKEAARRIDMIGTGTAPVKLEILGFQNKGEEYIPTQTTLNRGPKSKTVGSFCVQIASFSRIEGAMITQEKHDNTLGYKSVIKDTQHEDGRLFRVWLSGFKSEEEARDFIAAEHFEHSFIVRD
ncbi:MAG: septal ring lytic transglycosylase RlpA family protein [Campylobacterota bacterium]|nr:septal ring lytic transglycosylase RlpA family protein [Campylobacterota bacterium]